MTLAGLAVSTPASASPAPQLPLPHSETLIELDAAGDAAVFSETVDSLEDDEDGTTEELQPDPGESVLALTQVRSLSVIHGPGQTPVANSSERERCRVPVYLLTERLRL